MEKEFAKNKYDALTAGKECEIRGVIYLSAQNRCAINVQL